MVTHTTANGTSSTSNPSFITPASSLANTTTTMTTAAATSHHHLATYSSSSVGTVATTNSGGNDLVSAVPKFFGSLLSSSTPAELKQQVEINGALSISNSVNAIGGAISALLPPIVPAELLYMGRQADKALSLSQTLVRRSEREVIPLGVSRPNGVAILATSDEKQIYAVVADFKR